MKHRFLSIIALMGVLAATPALALDLHGARAAGILGEKSDGYVQVLKSSAEADALASDVNTKRRAEYARISAENGQAVDVVAKLAAVEIAKKLK
jgi:uncharacterized protein